MRCISTTAGVLASIVFLDAPAFAQVVDMRVDRSVRAMGGGAEPVERSTASLGAWTEEVYLDVPGRFRAGASQDTLVHATLIQGRLSASTIAYAHSGSGRSSLVVDFLALHPTPFELSVTWFRGGEVRLDGPVSLLWTSAWSGVRTQSGILSPGQYRFRATAETWFQSDPRSFELTFSIPSPGSGAAVLALALLAFRRQRE